MSSKAYDEPPGYVNSIEAKVIDLSSKADKAAWILARACTDRKNRTKDEMIQAMTEAQQLIIEIRAALTGR